MSIEKDPLAERLFVVITDAVMRGVTDEGGFNVHNADEHRSFLRALGASMALFAMSAQAMGAHNAKTARAIVMNGFDSKFDPNKTPKVPS